MKLTSLAQLLITLILFVFPQMIFAASSQFDGKWEGITNDGSKVSMLILGNKVTSFSITTTDSSGNSFARTLNANAPIAGGHFTQKWYDISSIPYPSENDITVRIDGTFASLTSCYGTYYKESATPQTLTWQMTGGSFITAQPNSISFTDEISVVSSPDFETEGLSGLVFADDSFWASNKLSRIYRYNMSGKIIERYDLAAVKGANDLAFDGHNLWLVNGNDRKLYKISTQGTVLASYPLQMQDPYAHPVGLTYDGNYLWLYATYHDGYLFKIDLSGKEVARFPVNADINLNQAHLAFDGESILLIVESASEKIYKFNLNGRQTTSYDTPFTYVKGITFCDGYLWAADLTKVYKSILPKHVSIGKSLRQTIKIQNYGNISLQIHSITTFANGQNPFSVAYENCIGQAVLLNHECTVDILFSPTDFSHNDGILEISSNDLHHPSLQINLSGKVDGASTSPILKLLLH